VIVTADVHSGFPDDSGGLEIVVREQGTTTTIEVEGEWDLASVPTARETLSRVLEGGPECVVLDLSRLAFIDSSGLQVLVWLSQRAQLQETRLVMIRGPRAVQRLFEITGLDSRLPLIDKQLTGRQP
jgi:anti-sigma B factor antagonist